MIHPWVEASMTVGLPQPIPTAVKIELVETPNEQLILLTTATPAFCTTVFMDIDTFFKFYEDCASITGELIKTENTSPPKEVPDNVRLIEPFSQDQFKSELRGREIINKEIEGL